MQLAPVHSPARRGSISAEEAAYRPIAAVLKKRAQWLLDFVPQRQSQALRLCPALLQASFQHRELKGDPPGVEGVRPGRSWTELARAFDLPPPMGSQRGRRLFSALLSMSTAQGLEVVCILSGGLGRQEEQRARNRLEVVEGLLRKSGVAIRVVPLSLQSGEQTDATLVRLMALGALIAGKLTTAFWERVATIPARAEAISQLWSMAPTPLTRHLLVQLVQGGPLPLPALRDALCFAAAEGFSPFWLADPELFCTLWVAAASSRPALVFELSSYVAASGATRQVARGLVNRSAFAPFFSSPVTDTTTVLRLGRELAIATAESVRRAPASCALAARQFLREEVLRTGFPKVLLPSLGASIREFETRQERLSLQVVEAGTHVEIQGRSGALLGRGRTLEQAWVRALSLTFQALGRVSLSSSTPREWQVVSTHLLQFPEKPTTTHAIEMAEVPGPPYDPLNRGPERRLGFTSSLLLSRSPSRRPSARKLSAASTVAAIAEKASQGTPVEVVACTGDAQPAASRLGRLVHSCRAATIEVPLAIEAGGRVLVLGAGTPKWFSVPGFLSRPRRMTPDLEAPDFGAGVAMTRSIKCSAASIDCLVWATDGEHAGVLYADSRGYYLREDVPIRGIEEHLTEAQTLLRQSPSPSVLSIRVAAEIAEVVERRVLTSDECIDVVVCGSLPFGLRVELLGERFGADETLGWSAAAQAVLSHWPLGVKGRLRVQSVAVEQNHRLVTGIARLYARSVALRRLWTHILVASGSVLKRAPERAERKVEADIGFAF